MSIETSEQNTTPTDNSPLAMDDAVNLLSQAEMEAPEGESEEPVEEEAEEQAEDQSADGEGAPDDDPASEEGPDESEAEEPEAPAIDPPKFWSADEKALFAKAPPEVQQLVAQKDADAERRVYAAKEEAAEARKDASAIGEFAKAADQLFQRANEVFKDKWAEVDWLKLAQEDPVSYNVAKELFQSEQQELQRLQTAKTATEAEEHRQFLKAEGSKLKEANHVLADPVKGPDEKKKLLTYAEELGFKPNDLAWAGANELTVLHKAMLYDRIQETARTKPPAPKSEPKAKAAPVRPSAPPPPRKQIASRNRQEIVGRALKSGRMDDGIAALLAIEKG